MVAYVPPKQAGKYKAVASGAITNGKPVVVNSTGTVSAVGATSSSSQTQEIGSETVFNSDETNESRSFGLVYDSHNERTVVAFCDQAGDLNAKVFSVSGTTITVGSKVEIQGAGFNQAIGAAFDSNSNKVVIAFSNGNDNKHGYAVVGTVDPSDNSISFGSATEFENADVYEASSGMGATFDSNSNKVLIVYADGGNSNYGTGVIGTVSGTSISFGTPVVFNSAGTEQNRCAFDSNTNICLIGFKDAGDNNKAKAITATISGTTFSTGNEHTLSSSSNSGNEMAIAFDTSINKFLVHYDDDGGHVVVVTVSSGGGDDIAKGTAAEYQSGQVEQSAIVYDPVVNKFLVSFADGGNTRLSGYVGTVSGTSISYSSEISLVSSQPSKPFGVFDASANSIINVYCANSTQHGTAIAFKAAGTATLPLADALTTENYIGIASGGTYPDTAEATIDVVGTVNKDQSGLTAGQTYYVQTDGTLGTSADDPSVVAGTAISATEIIVKG